MQDTEKSPFCQLYIFVSLRNIFIILPFDEVTVKVWNMVAVYCGCNGVSTAYCDACSVLWLSLSLKIFFNLSRNLSRNSHRRCSIKRFLKNFVKFRGKRLCFNSIKKTQAQVFSCKFGGVFKNAFLQSILGRRLLTFIKLLKCRQEFLRMIKSRVIKS